MTDRTFEQLHTKNYLVEHYATLYAHKRMDKELEDEYETMLMHIRDSLSWQSCSKHHKIRVNLWIEQLEKQHINLREKQNRNHYMRLLYLMLRCECFRPPFNNMPVKGLLPLMSKQQYQAIIEDIQRSLKKKESNSKNTSALVSYQASTIALRPGCRQKSFLTTMLSRQTRRKSFNDSNKKIEQNMFFESTANLHRKVMKKDKTPETISIKKQNSKDHSQGKVHDFDEVSCSKNTEKYPKYSIASKCGELMMQFDEIAGLHTDNFVSEKLKTMIQESTCTMKRYSKGASEKAAKTVQQSAGNSKVSLKHPSLQELNLKQLRYWQINSNNDNSTPKYLNLYQSNPYASLNISQQQPNTSADSEAQCCDCLSNLFKRKSVQLIDK